LFTLDDGVAERIIAIYDLAGGGIDSATFARVMAIMVDLQVDADMAMWLQQFAFY
jgi:hypothetical protein